MTTIIAIMVGDVLWDQCAVAQRLVMNQANMISYAVLPLDGVHIAVHRLQAVAKALGKD